MFDLAYNIDFEILAFLFAILLAVETRVYYPGKTRKNRIFRVMCGLVILTEGLDMLSAVTITYGKQIPNAVNLIINTAFFALGLLLCFVLHYYIEKAVIPENGRPVLLSVNKIVLGVMEILVVLNVFFGYFFSFSPEGKYVHGPFYLVMHLVSFWFVLCASVSLVVNRKLLKRAQIVSSVMIVLLYFVAVVLQTFIFSDILIIMPAVSAMLIIAIFSMESPDYAQLQRTLQELTETKQKLEAANGKYYNLAYTDPMTGLGNRTEYNIRLEQLGTAASREGVIFLMADVNDLKTLNDRFGHLIGDDAIVRTAELLKKNFSGECQCYRIGGDEFAVVSSRLTQAAFLERYDRFTAEAGAEGSTVSYPFSMASGYQPVGSLTLLDALRLADEKMYADKAAYKKRRAGNGERAPEAPEK